MPKVTKTVSLLYLCKQGRGKYDFLHVDKHQSFLQAGIIVFTGHSLACPKNPKW